MQHTDLTRYAYTLPPERIRTQPLAERDAARLFVYDTRTNTTYYDTVRNLAAYLPEGALMVVNDTRVMPARLHLVREHDQKPTELLVMVNLWDGSAHIPGIVDRSMRMGYKLVTPDGDTFEVVGNNEQIFFFTLAGLHTLAEILERHGTTPVPHYLESTETPSEAHLRTRYQTIFAERGASVAAPTASLHFTDHVFASLTAKGIERHSITLNVGLGTFAPLQPENFEAKRLHAERVEVSLETAEALTAARAGSRLIIAVGTTVTRTLETVCTEKACAPYTGSIDTFIYPPHTFRAVDILMTNFHLPKTSLMLLVDAFLQHKGAKRDIISLYEEAIREGFAFYSFGDSMLII